MIQVGVSIIDITPPNGMAMAGFAARTGVATGEHDALTVRALVVDKTAVVTVDVIGIDANLSARARARADKFASIPITSTVTTAVLSTTKARTVNASCSPVATPVRAAKPAIAIPLGGVMSIIDTPT